jgi:hypothetical protein
MSLFMKAKLEQPHLYDHGKTKMQKTLTLCRPGSLQPENTTRVYIPLNWVHYFIEKYIILRYFVK